MNTPPNLSIISPKRDVSFYPNTPNPLTVVFAVADVDNDRLTLQYKFDADPIWTDAQANFTGSTVTWNMRAVWTMPYLAVRLHKVRFQVHDGLDTSQVVVVNYRVTALGVPLADEEPEDVEEEDESSVDFSVKTLPGVAIGVGITIVVAVIVIIIVRRQFRKRSSSSSVDQQASIKIP